MEGNIKKNLIIGKNSQLTRYFKDDKRNKYFVTSAKNNMYRSHVDKQWDNVYVFFSEQRTFLASNKDYKDEFYNVNFGLTKQVINDLEYKNLVFTSTTELWNNVEGPISTSTKKDYIQNYYTDSKMKITEFILNLDPEKHMIVYPYNFNSIYRKDGFLFSKIYKSIIEEKNITISNIDFDREILHAKYVARCIKDVEKNEIIGAGRLVNVVKFVKELYNLFDLDFKTLVNIDQQKTFSNKRKINWKSVAGDYTYEKLVADTFNEIKKVKNDKVS